MIRSSLSVASVLFLTLIIGCGPNVTPGVPPSADTGDPTKKSEVLVDLTAQEKGPADLDRQIAAKEKELADLKAKADAWRDKIVKAKGAGAGGTTPLFELLAKLPKDCWPKDKNDSLRKAEAEKWFKNNLTGKRVSWSSMARNRDIDFQPDQDEKYRAMMRGKVERVKLYDSEWEYGLWRSKLPLDDLGDYFLIVDQLSKQEAEKLRLVPNDQVLAFTFKIKSVKFSRFNEVVGLEVIVEGETIKGIGP